MRRKPDRSKLVDLFETTEEIIRPDRKAATKRKAEKKPVTSVSDNNKSRFLVKLEEEAFHEFDYKDWYQYFVWRASENGVKYLTRNYAKEYAIIKSILNELSWTDVKNMMDFIFESDQDIADKRTAGLWLLSKGWINTIYQNTQLWMDGDYKPKTAPKRNREWVAEASRKDTGTGLRYGKPVRDEETGEEKVHAVKRRGSVRF